MNFKNISLLVVLFTPLFFSCSLTDDEVKEVSESQVVGTWEIISVKYYATNESGNLEYSSGIGKGTDNNWYEGRDFIDFNQDGTYEHYREDKSAGSLIFQDVMPRRSNWNLGADSKSIDFHGITQEPLNHKIREISGKKLILVRGDNRFEEVLEFGR
jgi:hypothetical protein